MTIKPRNRKVKGKIMTQAIEMTFDEWFNFFKPQENPIETGGFQDEDKSYMFETYGECWEKVTATPIENIWTIIQGDDGKEYIVAGRAFVNRLGYFITKKAWTDENQEVLFDF